MDRIDYRFGDHFYRSSCGRYVPCDGRRNRNVYYDIYSPCYSSDLPITVILIMIAVICAAATMQACGGLDYLVRIAEKILRKNPKMITVLAPVVAYIFTFMCGTGHIVYSLLPVINEIAIETGVRPEDRFPHRSFLHSRRSQRVRFQRQQSESSLSWQRQQIIRK